jgi:hypothetical protein
VSELLRSRECRFEQIIIPNARRPTMFCQTFIV